MFCMLFLAVFFYLILINSLYSACPSMYFPSSTPCLQLYLYNFLSNYDYYKTTFKFIFYIAHIASSVPSFRIPY